MLFSEKTFIGIDPTAGRKPFTYAVLDADCNLLALDAGELDDALAFLATQVDGVVAVNGPRQPSMGLVKIDFEKQHLLPGQMRGGDLRKAEQVLKERGIAITATPSKRELCPEWMQLCFSLHQSLGELGFGLYPAGGQPRQWLETQAHAAYCVMAESQPFSKTTLEGRLQRQVILHEAGVGVKDPMDFFEEVTRHRMAKGILPYDLIYSGEQLDALVAAYVAFLAGTEPEAVHSIGDEREGRITLPVKQLKEKY